MPEQAAGFAKAIENPIVASVVLYLIWLPAEAVLFVGDRYDIDLRLPEQQGCPVLLTKTIDELMQLQTLLDQPPSPV